MRSFLHPLDLAAGAGLRLLWAAGLLLALWALILWALAA
jgi:hypothetical protein